MTIIESNEHRDAVQSLMADPIIQDMMEGLRNVPDDFIMHPDGTPRHQFMSAANEEYDKRGGQNKAFMGSVARALIELRKEQSEK